MNSLIRAVVIAGFVLVFAPAAQAVIPVGNQLSNGDAETGTPYSTNSADTIPSWAQVENDGEQEAYSAADGPDAADSTAIGGGNQFFFGGFSGNSVLRQDIDVSAIAEIAGGGVVAIASGYLGGYAGSPDRVDIQVVFLDDEDDEITDGFDVTGPGEDDLDETSLESRQNDACVPPGTETIRVELNFIEEDGGPGINSGLADNISLTLEDGSQTACDSDDFRGFGVKAPQSQSYQLSAAPRTLSGTVPGATEKVRVSLVRRVNGRCYAYTGRRFRRASCKSGATFTVAVAGRRWSHQLGRRLGRGVYQLKVRTIDAYGGGSNQQLRFRVKKR